MHTLLDRAQGALLRGIRAFTGSARDRAAVSAPAGLPSAREIFNSDQLAYHAHAIAAEHDVTSRTGDVRVLQRALDRDERLIRAAYLSLTDDTRNGRPLAPAAEWLLDNMHVVVEQVREIRHDLPHGYYDELPKLTSGPLAGHPRVYAIARELIGHTDSRLDLAAVLQFILNYQAVTPLTMGELWAVAIMLRFGLVENLARISGLILAARATRDAADVWADRLLLEDAGADMALSPVLAELARGYPELSSAFGARLLHRLRTYDGERDVGALVTWLEQQPIIPYQNIEALIHAEHQWQAAQQAAVGNTITSMRALNTIDWADWFEQVSLVDHALRQDPSGAYAQSTFATRDHYRHMVEQLARRSGVSELDVARRVVEIARRPVQGEDISRAHVGHALIDVGRASLEAELDYHPTPLQAIQRVIMRHPSAWYLGALAVGTAGVVAGVLRPARRVPQVAAARPSPVVRFASALLLALPASMVTKEVVDRVVAAVLPPRRLPRLDLRDGIPAELRTIVVVPTLLLTPESVRGQLTSLEILALANNDPHLHFALLSDFADAPAAEMPGDSGLLGIARAGVEELNARYGSDRFLLLHRRRVWNERQGSFMGWERKRGKLEEFNRLLVGAEDTTFDQSAGDLAVLPRVRYVITLDADTQLPRDAGRALIGTLAHPLNQAVVDPRTRQVMRGYGILQPRIGITLPSALRSRFARILSGNVGIDPYTTAVSDVYMDLFGEGMYAGKGIYDPRVLRETLADRFPENLLLSHDLIEGAYARVGLLSDVELLDSYPATYASFAARQHRWVRGDWQIAAWLLPWTPSAHGLAHNMLPAIARFKILDNLRRSLVPPAIIALLANGWLRGRSLGQSLTSTSYALLPLALPHLLDLAGALAAVARGPDRGRVLRSQAEQLRLGALRFGLNVAFLPDQAGANLDAIGRTLARLLIYRRNLLQWETAEAAHIRLTRSWRALLGRMAPLAAAGAVATVARAQHLAATWPAAAPVVAGWLAAPALAAWLDQPSSRAARPLGADDHLLLRRLARGTWAYFEQFVTEESNYLAPDNFQETPVPLAAFRTSPTNIGLQLLADLAAYDFGYIGVYELTERTERVFATLARMQHEHGHLLNWYDTRTLQPLSPAYISTVDSGNLAGALLTLRQGYLELRDRPLLGSRVLSGLRDTLAFAQEQLPAAASAARQELAILADLLVETPSAAADYQLLLRTVERRASEMAAGESGGWAARLAAQACSFLSDIEQLTGGDDGEGGKLPAPLLNRHIALADEALEQVLAMDFTFLYDDRRRLFAIGHSLAEGRRDSSFYDLLASEARLASFLAIAKGDIPQEHWFQLGRTLLDSGAGMVLASWSGTMFEYLMPLLVMRTYPGTLLDRSYQAAVARQIQYGREKQVPWGVSESAYNARDPAMNYQYRAFGVPGLGLKRGLGGDLVVAPYATALALPVRPHDAIGNLAALIDAGMSGRYGLYEAIDYTPDRLPPGASHAIVRSYMTHHQGMSLVAFANALHDGGMQRRFHAETLVQATETLLQEQIVSVPPLFQPIETAVERSAVAPLDPAVRHVTTPTTAVPYTHLLSNGVYTVMLTNAGGGYSAYAGMAVTRWRSDAAKDSWGSFCYIRDVRSGLVWSAAYQPTRHEAQGYCASFGLDKVEFRQQVAGIETRMEIVVSPEDNVEVRRISLTNLTSAPRELEVTSYAEIVLAPAATDSAHPAFSNLFIETEFVPEHDALLASRRPRLASETRAWALHVIAVRGHAGSVTEYETDRAAFIGRGRTTGDPVALHAPLTRRVGAVLDPIFSLRRRLRIAPGSTAQITFTTGVADSRDQAIGLAGRYRDPEAAPRALAMAWTDSQVELRHLNITAADAQRFQRLAASVLYLDSLKRARPEVLVQNTRGQAGLWGYGISGDEPIVLVHVAPDADLSLVQELLQAHQYWRLKQFTVDLVLVNGDSGGYLQRAQDQLLGLVRSGGSSAWLNQRGGVFVLRADVMPEEDRVLLQTAARAVLSTERGGLAQHLRRREADAAPQLRPPYRADGADSRPLPKVELRHCTPYGGFDADGAFVIDLAPGQVTPLPWINVIANERFGLLVTERGGGYTWAGNSRENRLTPWSNDPVSDPPGEVLYLRDEESGVIWSPMSRLAGEGHVRVRHGFGATMFAQQRHTIGSELSLSVPRGDPVKLYRLALRNDGDVPRRLSVTLYVEWVLGVLREGMAPHILTERDEATGAILARNPYNPEFGGQVAFLACSEPQASICGDRVAFIGRNGDLERPAALQASALSGQVGAGVDPCGAVQCVVELAPGEERELVFLLGQGADRAEARRLIERYRAPADAAAAERETRAWWNEILGQVQVKTPEPELDLLLNGWLLYQTLACRIWARSAFYQSGGAYGFRDQLQDVMALVHAAPEIARAQILRAAARQFVEGDVQHWWHPPDGRGVRTGFSDDYLWLPFVVHHYVGATGDAVVLDEFLPFLEGRPLKPGEAEYYDLPSVSEPHGSLYEHCVRAIDYGLGRMGPHGLPLMGAGDWNDGMNLVGESGAGESVWVGWFLITVLTTFIDLAERRADRARAARYCAEAERLRTAIETGAWDGDWYLRAFYDDGTPLGAHTSNECRIDSLAQSWAVISGAGDPKRARQGMAAVDAQLVDREAGLIRLFTPAFDRSDHNPGYIKGYVPGVRENGGQYTHAAIWTIWAWTVLGEGGKAGELLRLISPVLHAAGDSERYMVEPYVIAADVYTAAGHEGRGGWTWYTGSAGWLYRLGVEQVLGLRREGYTLTVAPCLPPEWPGYEATYRVGATTYAIRVARVGGSYAIALDGKPAPGGRITLCDDGGSHNIEVRIP